MTASAPERHFPTFQRGDIREDMLASFRFFLRQLTNPDTNLPFTETEIATATAQLSRWYIDADATDLVLLMGQQRALFLANQLDPTRANTAFLDKYHAGQRGMTRAPAAGGSGLTLAPAPAGTIFVGSTTVPDPAAHYATDPAGLRYQVLFTVITPGGGIASLVLKGVDTGEQTNLAPGTQLKWANGPVGATAPATVSVQYTGGVAIETDAQYAKRVLDEIRHKQAAGNRAHMRGWARESSAAVEDACIYACAYHAGSTHIALIQRRGNVKGPLGRIASTGTLTDATAYLTPPGSPVVPTPPHMVLTACPPVSNNAVLELSMPKGLSSGWTDLQPWPGSASGLPATVTFITSQTGIQITVPVGSIGLPAGVTAPSLMIWNDAESRFEKLLVTEVEDLGLGEYSVILSAPPSKTIALGDYICPDAGRRDLIGETIEAYFDSLGPGELVDLASDNRAHRAFRFPEPSETLPQRAGTSIIGYLQDALGAALADANVASMSVNNPPRPADMVLGPSLIVAGRVGVYPLA